jgi:hypothetical protein
MTDKILNFIGLFVMSGVRNAAPGLVVTAIIGIAILGSTVDLRSGVVEAVPQSKQVQGLILAALRSL